MPTVHKKTRLFDKLITKALSCVRSQDVAEWEKQHVCANRYRLMRRMAEELKNAGAKGGSD